MPNPTRPVQDAIIDPAWGQWVHDQVARLVTTTFRSYVVTTDASGNAIIPAANLGLATVTGVVANCSSQGSGNTTYHIGEVPIIGNQAYLRVVSTAIDTNDVTVGIGTVSVNVMAWGTPLTATTGAETRPGDDLDHAETQPGEDLDAEPK